MAVADDMTEQLTPLVEDLGYELVGVEYVSNPKNRLVRIYIDQPEGMVRTEGDNGNDDAAATLSDSGIDVDDCERVSREVSAWLDVEDPISGEYSLEVSSPGVERPLFRRAHYERFLGERAEVQLVAPLVDEASGQRQRVFKGVLASVIDDESGVGVVMVTDKGEQTLPLAQVAKAKLKPDMDQLLKEAKSKSH
ncbi:MAG: ribosome maturation factor RimP [Wenzhouxiangella sp.]|nr:ribosome maturation factor RimP [Wenzhouxiangella sp.]MDR9453651.1 ribosome maturation factor RimP [Wenzhouxiangella sp.]